MYVWLEDCTLGGDVINMWMQQAYSSVQEGFFFIIIYTPSRQLRSSSDTRLFQKIITPHRFEWTTRNAEEEEWTTIFVLQLHTPPFKSSIKTLICSLKSTHPPAISLTFSFVRLWCWLVIGVPNPRVYTHATEWSRTHVKDLVVHVRVRRITETRKTQHTLEGLGRAALAAAAALPG